MTNFGGGIYWEPIWQLKIRFYVSEFFRYWRLTKQGTIEIGFCPQKKLKISQEGRKFLTSLSWCSVRVAEEHKEGRVYVFGNHRKGWCIQINSSESFALNLRRKLIFRLGQLKRTNNKKRFFKSEGGEIKRKINFETGKNEVDEFRVCLWVSLFTLKGQILEMTKGGDWKAC